MARLAKAAVDDARRQGASHVLIDMAGRLQVDQTLMDELKRVREAVAPTEVLLVADGMTGQEAVRIAEGFHETVGLTGVILTKMDGDARGGAALSIFGVLGAGHPDQVRRNR
jgi:signal recognition particle subunit SRP54